MPNKSRVNAVALIILILAILLSITSLALASSPRLPENHTPFLSNVVDVQASQQVDHLAGVDNQIFLPIVSNRPAGLAVPNGDFESGPIVWTEFSTNSRNLILFENDLPVAPHSGSWAAWLGGANDDISYIEQTLTIPAGSPHFTYWHWIDSEEVNCVFDFAGVFADDSLEDVYDLCSDNNTSGWRSYSVDLSAYAGETRTIQIWAETNNNGQVSSLYIDDVSFKSYPSSSSLIKTRKVEK
jgi:hypothetical protein